MTKPGEDHQVLIVFTASTMMMEDKLLMLKPQLEIQVYLILLKFYLEHGRWGGQS